MKSKSIIFGASLLLLLGAQQPTFAQTDAPKGAAASRQQFQSLLSAEERNQFREKMRAAKTREERTEIQKQRRAITEQRAKEKGVTLPQARDGRRGPGAGPGARDGRRGGEGARPQLLTAEERQQYRSKMRSAKTPEERTQLRSQMRSLAEQRAKEKGITLPERRGPGSPQKGAAPTGRS